jgi:hypothetical protein
LVKREKLDPKPERKVDLFLDSGVFSAWNRKMTLDLKLYCDFIKRNEHLLQCYATMDVIPGQFGVKRTQKDVEQSAKGSYDNQQVMKSRGLKPIPIFHQGEDYKWLERYIKDGEPYIGISTAKDLRSDEQRQWCDLVFSMITDAKGRPHVKTHGFGITNISLLLRYPWFTADSTTWSLAAGFGLIYVPRMNGDKPDYNSIPMRIITSGRTQKAWSSAKRQYEALNAENLEWVQRWMKHVEITPEDARFKSSTRRLACLRYFNEFAEHHDIKPYPLDRRVKRMGLLEPELDLHIEGKAPPLWPHMRIMSATMMHNGQFSLILNKANARNRLVSYWEIMNRDEQLLANFVQDGITDINYKPRKMRIDWDNETYLSQRAMMLIERNRQYGTEEDRGSAD